MQVRNDPMGTPGHDRPGQVARGLFVEVGKRYLDQVDLVSRELQQGDAVSRQDLLAGLGSVRGVWEGRAPGRERDLALGRLAADEAWMQGCSQSELAGLAGQLKSDCDARVARMEWIMLGSLVVAVGGAAAYLGPALLHVTASGLQTAGGLTCLAGILGAGTAGSLRDRPPQLGTLGRLYVYADAARPHQEVGRLADSLGGKNPSNVAVTEKGVSVGGVFLPRRQA